MIKELGRRSEEIMSLPQNKKVGKIERVLEIYTKLLNGGVINPAEQANIYGVTKKSIQRDISDIKNYMQESVADSGIINSIICDKAKNEYRLQQTYPLEFSNSEILAICKILLDSRAFTKKEMNGMLEKLIKCCIPKSNQKRVKELIRNEQFHYIEPHHKTVFIDKMWDLGKAIQERRYIEIKYRGVQGSSVKTRKLKPLAIMFSEYYFYLTAFIEDKKVQENFNVLNDSFPTIYRIDRIRDLKLLDERYKIPYANRFEEGEFRKRIQFMYGGRLRKIRFIYMGYSLEAILDKLPTAKIEKQQKSEDGKRNIYTISAEVFGDGVDMWIRSQGDQVQLI